MDPYAPINGISLERYAELGAELDGITGDSAQLAKVQSLGVSAEDWAAAKAGWTARMQDMSLMGAVATKYMQIFNEKVASKKGGGLSCTFDEWVVIGAAIQVFGYEAAMNQYGISSGDWTNISSHWQAELGKDPMNLAVRRNQLQAEEAARLKGGGQPRPIEFQKGAAPAPAGGAAPAPAPAAPAPAPAAFSQGAAAPAQFAAAQQQGQAAMAHAAGILNQPGVQGALGMANALGGLVGIKQNAFPAGSQVLVQWSDGNKYPGTVMQAQDSQAMIAFPDGRQMWLEHKLLSTS